jgi:hypothetical protein
MCAYNYHMGRPLTDRYIGRGDGVSPVLRPLTRISGRTAIGYILKQVGSDKFLVENDLGERAICRLSNTRDLTVDGTMCIGFSGRANGFAFRITNTKVRDWHGNSFAWNMVGPEDHGVYVHDNSLDGAK